MRSPAKISKAITTLKKIKGKKNMHNSQNKSKTSLAGIEPMLTKEVQLASHKTTQNTKHKLKSIKVLLLGWVVSVSRC